MGKGSEGQKGKGDRGGKGGKGTNGLKNIPDEDCAKGCQRDCWNQDYAFENSRHCFVLVATKRLYMRVCPFVGPLDGPSVSP